MRGNIHKMPLNALNTEILKWGNAQIELSLKSNS